MTSNMAEHKDDKVPRGVYFIYAPNQNKIKIGRSKNIETRFIQLRTGFMDEGVLLFGILTPEEVKLESDLHARFSHLRDNGEWFFLTKELREFIDSRSHLNSDIKDYHNIESIQNTLTYKSLGMFKLIAHLKSIQNKYALPLILMISGLVFAYNNYRLETEINRSEMLRYGSYLLLVIYPVYTPILARHIIAYCSVRTGIFFFVLLAIGLIVELVNLLLPIDYGIINIIRILLLSAFMPFTKNVLSIITFRMREENIKKKATENYRSNFNTLELLDLRINIGKKYQKQRKLIYYLTYGCAGLTFLGLNVYLLLNSEHELFNRMIIISILDFGILFWAFLTYILKLDSLKKIKSFIVPVTIFLVQITSQYLEPETGMFWKMFSVMILGFSPVSVFGLYSTLRQKKYEIQMNELDEILEPILAKIKNDSPTGAKNP